MSVSENLCLSDEMKQLRRRIFAQRIAKINRPSYTNNTSPNTAKSVTANKYNIMTINYTSPSKQKSLSANNTSANSKKFERTNNTSAYAKRSISANNTSANSQKYIRTNNIAAYAKKSISTNNTSANTKKSTYTSYTLVNAHNSKIIYNTSSSVQKSKSTNNKLASAKKSNTANNSSDYAHKSLSVNNTSANAQKSKSASNTLLSTPKRSNNNIETPNMQRLEKIYREKVDNAYKKRLIFTIHGKFRPIRKALVERGWIEKFSPDCSRLTSISNLPEKVILSRAKEGNDYERVILNKMLTDYPAFFVWQKKNDQDKYCDVMPYRNYIKRSENVDFTTKTGLIGCAEQDHCFNISGLCGKSCPRFYRLLNTEERTELIEDYRRTQCRNLVRFVIENISTPYKLADMKTGTIPTKTLTCAIEYMERQLSEWEYLGLDMASENQANTFITDEWENFFKSSQSIILGNSKFKASIETIHEYAVIGKEYLNIIEQKHPDYKWDGVRNIWILKPANRTRGLGIVVKNSLDDILRWASYSTDNNYIAQKYIERPLLVHNTKFDIRQYMLISIGKTNISIWLYKDCYLKFSSQAFSLDDLRVSIHLTNNAVQKHYTIDKERDRRLPHCNMWELEQFINYLEWIKAPANIWSKKIFAGFKENLIAVVLASFDDTYIIPNTFELFGCDFMLDEDYNPILIEINRCPDLAATTPVTAQLCPMVLDDLIKVVVDLPNNPFAQTGLFSLAHKISYRGTLSFFPKFGLNISGKAMPIHQQETKNEEEKISKQQLYEKLFAKRTQLSKYWNFVKSSEAPKE